MIMGIENNQVRVPQGALNTGISDNFLGLGLGVGLSAVGLGAEYSGPQSSCRKKEA
jgi:hypothetical protein